MAWPASSFPTSLDSITDKVDNVDDIMAADVNGCYDCIEKIQAKLGVDGSAVTSSIDYLLKNASSANPGHRHTLAQGATDVTATAAEVNLIDGSVAGTAVANKALVLGASKNVDTLTVATLASTTATLTTANITTLNIGGVQVTSSAAELNLIDGSSAGTAVASKALVLGASKNVDTLTIATLASTTATLTTANITTLNLGGVAVARSATAINNACNDVDHGDITVSATGATWTIDAGVITEGKLGASAVAQAKLKTTAGEISLGITTELTESYTYYGSNGVSTYLPGGSYGFWPQFKKIDSSYAGVIGGSLTLSFTTTLITSYASCVALNGSASGLSQPSTCYIYVLQRYVTSSGEVNWVFFLRDKTTKQIKARWYSSDHPCFGNGGNPELLPHPFVPDETEEVICFTMTDEEIESIKEGGKNRSLLQIMSEDYEIDEQSDPVWPDKEVTVGLPEGHNWKAGEEVRPIKKKIPKPVDVLYRKLKRK